MNPTVTTRYGKVEGIDQDGVTAFKGIPFAAPPVGPLRWMAPEKPKPWTGTREAREYGNACPQDRMPGSVLAAMIIEEPQSEDCLYLNVWTPKVGPGKRPVMVWIHGGAFRIGSGGQRIYDGSNLARRGDAVVVTINYRLGPFGFLRLIDVTDGNIPATGNEGMLDQVAALQWVNENIAEFGGDPGNVTIFGESAGGMSVGALLAMPSARGLFHKAIPQSGACHTGAVAQRANRIAERIMARIGASDPQAIRALGVAPLLKGTMLDNGVIDPELGMAYQPCIDGTVLPKVAIESVAGGSAKDVAVLVGSTLEEWKLFAVMDPSLAKIDKAGLAARIGARLAPEAADALITNYEKVLAGRGNAVTPPEVFNAIETDRIFRIPAIRLAETQLRHDRRVFNYLFTWKSPAAGGLLGSCHALELGFVFGTNDVPGMPQFSGTGPAAERLAIDMQDVWLAFARTGDPSCDSLGAIPAYSADKRATVVLGQSSKVLDAPYDLERRSWDVVPEKILGSL